ncbi:Uncharacterised protein [uncultured archaeon]|nr:Uncharacterised protein [uncultured archaeon]
MSGIGNRIVISEIEENDLEFTTLWSQKVNLNYGTIFFNSELPSDVFFNKLTNITCPSDSLLDEALLLFHKYEITPFVYTLQDSKLE